MFNIGTGEIALIAVVALLILGPKGLPEMARGIGKFMREFRRQTDDVRTMVEREFYRMDQDLSIRESPETPLIRPPSQAVPRVASTSSPAPELLPPPPVEEVRSQVTGGMPAAPDGKAAEASAPVDGKPTS